MNIHPRKMQKSISSELEFFGAFNKFLGSHNPRTDIFCIIYYVPQSFPFYTTHLIIPYHSSHKNSEKILRNVKEIPPPYQDPLYIVLSNWWQWYDPQNPIKQTQKTKNVQ